MQASLGTALSVQNSVFLNAHHHHRPAPRPAPWGVGHCIGLSVLKHAFGIINVTLYVLVNHLGYCHYCVL